MFADLTEVSGLPTRGERYCSSDSDTWKLPEDPSDSDLFPDFWDWDI